MSFIQFVPCESLKLHAVSVLPGDGKKTVRKRSDVYRGEVTGLGEHDRVRLGVERDGPERYEEDQTDSHGDGGEALPTTFHGFFHLPFWWVRPLLAMSL